MIAHVEKTRQFRRIFRFHTGRCKLKSVAQPLADRWILIRIGD